MNSIPVFFDRRMAADSGSFSPSAGKPPQVVAEWQRLGLPIEVVPFKPASQATIAMAHKPRMVRAILRGAEANGFGNRSSDVAQSLPYTSGSMVAAANHALEAGVACSPTSGFHHAGFDYCGAFCTFNSLVIAALKLRELGLVERVGILDCDQHYGNGTQNIIDQLGLDWITHVTHTRGLKRDPKLVGSPAFGDLVRREFEDAQILLYQAGADSHRDDPLGGYLSTQEMLARDRAVFAACADMGLPVAWNLAGGYQQDSRTGRIDKVLELHSNTMRACADQFCATWSPGLRHCGDIFGLQKAHHAP